MQISNSNQIRVIAPKVCGPNNRARHTKQHKPRAPLTLTRRAALFPPSSVCTTATHLDVNRG